MVPLTPPHSQLQKTQHAPINTLTAVTVPLTPPHSQLQKTQLNGKWLHTLPSHPAWGEPQGLSWGKLTKQPFSQCDMGGFPRGGQLLSCMFVYLLQWLSSASSSPSSHGGPSGLRRRQQRRLPLRLSASAKPSPPVTTAWGSRLKKLHKTHSGHHTDEPRGTLFNIIWRRPPNFTRQQPLSLIPVASFDPHSRLQEQQKHQWILYLLLMSLKQTNSYIYNLFCYYLSSGVDIVGAVVLCVQKVAWLPMLGTCNECTDVNVCDCKQVCMDSRLWEKNP